MFSYFGSKARLAPTYQAPQHDLIIEPFAGAAAYSMFWLSERSNLRCTLIDTDPVVVEMWEALLSLDPTDLWAYPAPTAGDRTTDPLYKAACIGDNGWNVKGGEYQVTAWMADAFPSIRRRMAHTLALVRGRVDIALGDYRDVPNVEATWFIDPPYQHEGHRYASGNALDFPRLGEWCRSRRGQVIVCEASRADWMEFVAHTGHRTMTGDATVEVVWYSHPEPNLLTLIGEAPP